MITLSSLPSGACSVKTESSSFDVFPPKAAKDTWTLLPHPEEELKNAKAISWPGEYDFSGVTVRGVGQQDGKQVSYHCTADNIRLAFVGNPVLEWNDADLDKLGDVDVLVVAADDTKKVVALVEEADPRVVVLFQVKGGDLGGVSKALGETGATSVKEFKVRPGSLPTDSRQVVVLSS